MTELDIHARIAQAQSRPSIDAVLARMQPDIAKALPKGLDPDRVARLALTAIRTSEVAKAKGVSKTALSESTPESFAGALLTAVALGLEPGTAEAYLIPYRDRRSGLVECQLIIGYQGMVKLYRQHPRAAHIGAQAVYENDTFDYQYGSDAFLRHRPATGDRGEVIYYYADAGLTNGAYEFVVLTPDEVRALRNGKVGPSGDIPDPQHWMERKTVLRQLLKLLPRQTRVDAAMDADEKAGRELAREQVPLRIMETTPPQPEPQQQAPAIETPPEPPEPAEPNLSWDDRDLADPVTGEVPMTPPEPEPAPEPPRKQAAKKTAKKTAAKPQQADEELDPRLQPMTVQQRTQMNARWSALGLMADPDRRAEVAAQLLGVEPGSLKTGLNVGQADVILDRLNNVADRAELDQLLAGQTRLT